MAFRFRQFVVEDRLSTLRVGTDSMLLGSWTIPGNAQKILDIGTGCGVLALMMAQKSNGMITAIDIDRPSIVEAGLNFSASPWSERLEPVHGSLQSFYKKEIDKYDFIITNPPYFSKSLKSPSQRINQARHDEHLQIGELAMIVSRLLTSEGSFSIILPPAPSANFQLLCATNGLFLSRRLIVAPKESHPPKRILSEFTRMHQDNPQVSELKIIDGTGKFTPEYLALTLSYHNF